MQQQTHSLCQEPFWICSSANVLTVTVFICLLFWTLHISKQSASCFVVFFSFCHLTSFKITQVPALFLFSFSSFFFFFRGFVPPKQIFSGTTLMRPSLRFHGDSRKTVKFLLFKKSWEGCSATVRATFSNGTSFPSKVNYSGFFWWGWIQPVCDCFYQNMHPHNVKECADGWTKKEKNSSGWAFVKLYIGFFCKTFM